MPSRPGTTRGSGTSAKVRREGRRPRTDPAGAHGTAGGPRVELLKALDAGKDQSYFLHRLTQEQLAPVLFPLGELQKRDVRAIAKREGIPTWAKKDSTGICFIGERPFREFLARYLPRTPGPMRTPEGVEVGRHDGLAYYTLGQRQGLGIGGTKDGGAAPWFVAGKDMATQRVWSSCRATTIRGCTATPSTRRTCTGSPARRRRRTRWRASAPRRATGCRTRRARLALDAERRCARDVRVAAVGADAGPVPGALRRRGVPRRRRHRRTRGRGDSVAGLVTCLIDATCLTSPA